MKKSFLGLAAISLTCGETEAPETDDNQQGVEEHIGLSAEASEATGVAYVTFEGTLTDFRLRGYTADDQELSFSRGFVEMQGEAVVIRSLLKVGETEVQTAVEMSETNGVKTAFVGINEQMALLTEASDGAKPWQLSGNELDISTADEEVVGHWAVIFADLSIQGGSLPGDRRYGLSVGSLFGCALPALGVVGGGLVCGLGAGLIWIPPLGATGTIIGCGTMAVSAVGLYACLTDDSDDSCGDGSCPIGESCFSCGDDCGDCATECVCERSDSYCWCNTVFHLHCPDKWFQTRDGCDEGCIFENGMSTDPDC